MKKIILFIMLTCFFASGGKACIDTTKAKASVKKTIVLADAPAKDAAKGCEKIEAVNNIIEEAISIGAPIYNQGSSVGCYRIYEGAAYKILYKYGAKCKEVRNILETALEKSYGDYSAADKAWIMRMAFDSILGVPTTTR